MDFIVNEQEMAALCGLPHIQQLAYFRGIKPYMNTKTGMVGIERGISYQSISEQLYIEPHPGIKSHSFSRAQVRRAIAGLERVGLIACQSGEHQLILKCLLATRDYYVSKKAVTNPSQKGSTSTYAKHSVNTGNSDDLTSKPDTDECVKADTPHKDNICLFLLTRFERFWSCYPNKQSRNAAWDAFQQLNPDDVLLDQILHAIDAQIAFRKTLQHAGVWMPAWKYPANWLSQQCWNDELIPVTKPENHHAKNASGRAKKSGVNVFYESCTNPEYDFAEDEIKPANNDNVVQFKL